MSIQYPVPGFEPTNFWTWVSSHNHQTRAPAHFELMQMLDIQMSQDMRTETCERKR